MSTLRTTFTRLLLLSSLALARPAFADDIDRSFEQGTLALRAGKYQDAKTAFDAVWKQRKTHDVAANLGLAEMQLGKHRDAAEHFAFALGSFPVTGDATLKKGIEAAFAQAKSHVMTLRVTVSVDGAEVLVDGTPIGRSPLAGDVFVEVGARTIEARLARYVTATKTVDAKKGGSDAVSLVLSPEPTPTATVTTTATAPPPPRSKVPAIVLGGVGVAGVVVGATLLGVGYATNADVSAKMPRNAAGDAQCQKPPVTGADAPACAELRARTSEANTFANAGAVTLALGGAAVAAGVLYLVWPSPSASTGGSATRFIPTAGPQGGGLVIQGAF